MVLLLVLVLVLAGPIFDYEIEDEDEEDEVHVARFSFIWRIFPGTLRAWGRRWCPWRRF
jgi:hypothetical protein